MPPHNGGPRRSAVLVQDLIRLDESRLLLVERLERVVAALALTLDAEAAAVEQLADLQSDPGSRRVGGRSAAERCRLSQRYRNVIHALESIHEEGVVDRGGPL